MIDGAAIELERYQHELDAAEYLAMEEDQYQEDMENQARMLECAEKVSGFMYSRFMRVN